jgi:hypothetical protein
MSYSVGVHDVSDVGDSEIDGAGVGLIDVFAVIMFSDSGVLSIEVGMGVVGFLFCIVASVFRLY